MYFKYLPLVFCAVTSLKIRSFKPESRCIYIRERARPSFSKPKLWIRRDSTWVLKLITGSEALTYLQLFNYSENEVYLGFGAPLGLWMMNSYY